MSEFDPKGKARRIRGAIIPAGTAIAMDTFVKKYAKRGIAGGPAIGLIGLWTRQIKGTASKKKTPSRNPPPIAREESKTEGAAKNQRPEGKKGGRGHGEK